MDIVHTLAEPIEIEPDHTETHDVERRRSAFSVPSSGADEVIPVTSLTVTNSNHTLDEETTLLDSYPWILKTSSVLFYV